MTSALAILLLLGLALRLTIAYVLYPGSGFSSDIGTFTAWAMILAEHGPGRFYEASSFADYPPAYLYVLWLVGGLGHLLAPLADGSAGTVAAGLIKIPPMLADIGVGYVLYRLVRGWAAEHPDAERLGLVAAALYVFNPVTWYDSALWGQTDSVGALVLLLAVGALVRGNSEGAAALTILAALVKPQFGVVLLPLTGAVLLHRHVFAARSGPRHAPMVPARLGFVRDWLEQERGLWRLISSAAVGLLLLLLMLLPFRLDVFGFLELMAGTAGGYPYLSVNAYNPWALIGSEGRQGLAAGGGWSSDLAPLFGPLPGVIIGALLLAAGFLLVVARLGWRADRRSIVVGAIVLALAFFILPTRVHERYMFPIFALLPLLAVVDRRWLWATVALSVAAFINFHAVLTNPLYATPNVANLPLGELFREPIGAYASVLLHTAGFAFAAWQLRPRLYRREDPYGGPLAPTARGGDDEFDLRVWRPLPAGVSVEGDAPWARPTSAAVGPASPATAEGAAWRRLGLMNRVLAVVPLRRDRSASLAYERGGRIDRLDLLILLLVFVGTLGLRTFSLAQPYGMHFDEVYHARTGTEFLQHWRYGMPHTIYEYTHPHLAKYAMAAGIDLLGNNRVTSVEQLGGAIRTAALERRWDEDGTLRRGDRAYIATAERVQVIDLATRREVASIDVVAEALAVDDAGHTLYIADAAGGLWQVATGVLDALRGEPGAPAQVTPTPLAQLSLPGAPRAIVVGGERLLVIAAPDTLVAIDQLSGSELGRATVPGATVAIATADDEGEAYAVGADEGVVLLDAETLDLLRSYPLDAPATGMAMVDQGVEPTIFVASGRQLHLLRAPSDEQPTMGEPIAMPGDVRDVYANPSAAMVHVLGTTPDGSASTIYVIAPQANSIFADAVLPFSPAAVLIDVQPRRPADDRLDALALSADGQLATVDIGGNAFAWRFPGVLAGALMAIAIYLLARFLFRRRSVAIIAALLVLLDGMMFANARIAMNDSYVALFITAAFALFAPLYMGRWRSRPAVAAGIVGVAVLLGLAMASKWVGAYALGGVVLLILLRSALGRMLALLAMIGMTSLLGYIAISPGPDASRLNFLFLALMVGLTVALAVAMALRPMRLTLDELRLMVVGPALGGGLLLAAGAWLGMSGATAAPEALVTPGRLMLAGAALLVLAPIAFVGARFAGRRGWGPLADDSRAAEAPAAEAEPSVEGEQPAPAEPGVRPGDPGGRPLGSGMPAGEPPPAGWLRPGSGLLGLPWLATLGTLAVVVLLIYVLSYAPWVALGNRWTADLPAGNTGQQLVDLQRSMYDYHNNLRATHAASSPWWAWPLDLKPVWFYQRDFAGGTTGVIYNTGNMVIFWLALPAVGFAAYQAWRRRSLALTLLVLAVAGLWLPWARIDRATFQYHVFTALPFAILCLAYFLAELWHGPSRRTWAFARVAGAVTIVLPAIIWLLRLPLCGVAGVEQVNANAEICQVGLARPLALTDLQVAGLAGIVAGLAALGVAWYRRDPDSARSAVSGWLPTIGLTMIGAGLVATLGGAFLPGPRSFEMPFGSAVIPLLWLAAPLIFLALLAVPAYYVLFARDARRYVVGALVAAALWLVVWYPNISGLPLPTPLSQAHLVTLPTLNYSFQFGVNTDPPGGAVDLLGVLMLLAVVSMLVVAAIYAVRSWREARREVSPAREAG